MPPDGGSNTLPSLPESELWVSKLLNELLEGIWSVDANTYQMLYVNQAVEKIYGYGKEEFYKNPNLWLEVINPREKESVIKCLSKVKKSGKEEIEYHLTRHNGETRFVRHKFCILTEENSSVKQINGIITDITELEKAQEISAEKHQELEIQKQLFQKITTNIPGVIFECVVDTNSTNKFTYISHACREICELEPLAIQQDSALMWNLIHPDDVEAFWQSVTNAAETFSHWQFQWRIITSSGVEKWLSGIGQPEQQSNGNLVWYGMLLDISDRKQIEVEKTRLITSLAESEAQSRSVLSALAEGVILQDSQGVILTCNASAKRILGLTTNQIIGNKWLAPDWWVVREDGSILLVDEHPNMITLRTGKPCENVIMGIHKPNGNQTWISVNTQPLFRLSEKKPYALVTSFTDITEKKLAEIGLRESEARFRNLLETSSDWVWQVNEQGLYTYVSPQITNILGYQPEEVLGKTLFRFMPPEKAEEFRIIFNRILAEGETIRNLENINLHKDGYEVVLETSAVPIFDEVGNLIGYSGINRDIRNRKRLELELANREALFKAFFAAAPAGMSIFDEQLRFVLINETLAEMNGFPVEAHIGRTLREVLPELAPAVEPIYQSILDTGESILNSEISGETPAKPGVKREWMVSWFPILNGEGKPTGIGNVVVEITGRKQAEAALRESEARNRAFLEAIPDLLFRVSKDGKYLDFKAKNENDLAVKPTDIIGKNISELLPFELAKEFFNGIELALATGKTQISEYQLTPIGVEVQQDFEARFVVVGDSEEVLVVVRNITDRKQSELALLESERRFRAVFDSMFEFMSLLEPDGKVLEANQTYLHLFGIDNLGVVGLYFWELPGWLPETQSAVEKSVNQARQGEFVRYEVDLMNPDGNLFTVDVSIKPILDETGKVVLLIAEGRDITDRKRAELERDRFFTVSLDLLCVGGFDGYFKRINPAWSNLLGYTQKELLSIPFIKLIHPEDREATLRVFKHNVTGQRVVGFENRCRAKDGSYKWLSWNVVPFPEDKLIYAIARDISEQQAALRERNAAEAALRQTTKKLQEAQRIAHIGHWEFDVINQNVTWSDEVFRIYGIETGRPAPTLPEIRQMIHPEDREMQQQVIATSLTEGLPCNFDYRVVRPNGEIRHIHSRGEPVHNEQGEVVQLLGMAMDITDRKQAEETLQRQEQFLRTIYDGFEQVIFVIDVCADSQFTYAGWNVAAERLSGISSAEGVGKTPLDIFGPELGAEMEARCIKCVKDGHSLSFEENLNFDESEKWSLTVITPLRNAQGQIYRIVGMVNDITDRKQAEIALQCSEAKSQELAARETLINRIGSMIRNSLELDTILENTVAEIYNHLQIHLCCFSWYRQDELPFWEVVKEAKADKIPSCLGNYPESLYSPISQKLLNLEIYKIDDISSIDNVELQHRLGEIGIASMLTLPLKTISDQIGALTCYRCEVDRPWTNLEEELLQAVCDKLAIALNQAELYQQSCESARYVTAKNEQLQQTLVKLKRTQSQLIQAEKMSSLGQLVAGIAHEINNPINFIFGNITYANDYISDILELIKLYQKAYPQPTAEIEDEIERIELDFLVDDLVKILQSMKVGAERIKEIVKSLRTFSRLDESDMKVVDIHENIESTLMILQNRLKGKPNCPSINVVKNYGELPVIECFPGQLNQVFMNIIANAIDALEERDKGLTEAELQANPSKLEISTVIKGTKRVEIRIADNGLGMSKKVIEKIFDPFYTTKPIGKGTGLGLSISYQIIIDKHSGELLCRSKLGVGTEFIINIPLKQVTQSRE